MNFTISEVVGLNGARLEKTERFLSEMGLKYEGGAEYTVFLTNDENDILGTGSLCGSILKYIAVSELIQGEGGAAAIVSRLVQYAYTHGKTKLFLFTKPENESLFRGLGFFTIAGTNGAVYMENSRAGIGHYLDSLKKGHGTQGAIVANCNPFTLGHLYLMETAAKMVDTLHVFIVSENDSEFPFDIRYRLVKEGTSHISNLILHESGDYIISHATFPAYFIKSSAKAETVNVELDLTLFGTRIAPALDITKRFVGTEPFCAVTRAYNEQMKQLLPSYGIKVIELPRKDGISASRVRSAIAESDVNTLRLLLPDVTFDYIINNILPQQVQDN